MDKKRGNVTREKRQMKQRQEQRRAAALTVVSLVKLHSWAPLTENLVGEER